MASMFVMKQLRGSNLLTTTRSVVRFPRTVATASRSFSTDGESDNIGKHDGAPISGSLSLNLSWDLYVKDEKERKLYATMSMNADVREEVDGMKRIHNFNLLNNIKKKEFSYKDDGFVAMVKDGVCKLSLPLKEGEENIEFEIKLN